MSKKPQPMTAEIARERVELAVQRAGRALNDLSREFEKCAAVLSETDVQRAFAFLGVALNGAQSRSGLALITGKAANGGFSLDQDVEAPALPTTLPSFNPVIAPPKPEGRMVGQGRKRVEDDDDDVVFLDD